MASVMNAATGVELGVASPRAEASARSWTHNLLGIPGLSLERLGWAALVTVFFSFWSNTAFTIAAGNIDLTAYIGRYPGYFRQYAPWLFFATILGSAADALPIRGALRTATFAAAFVAASWLGLVASSGLECLIDHCFKGPTLFSRGQMEFVLLSMPFTFGQTCAIALVYFSWRRDAEVAAALHASEVARVEAERERVQAALHAMQARVEPAFLLATLRGVGERCESDRVSGVRLLDLLIQYLRAALPRAWRHGSTFGREIALVQAYLGMCALRSNGALEVTCRYDDGLDSAAFPPMVLGPLVAAIAPPPAPNGALDVHARALDGRVRVTITAHGAIVPRLAAAAAINEARDRLAALYRERMSFVFDRPAADMLTMIVEVPQ